MKSIVMSAHRNWSEPRRQTVVAQSGAHSGLVAASMRHKNMQGKKHIFYVSKFIRKATTIKRTENYEKGKKLN